MIWNPFKDKGPPDAHLIKSCDDLCADDFDQYPAWIESHVNDFGNPIYEDLDEDAVRPWTGKYPLPVTTCCKLRASFQAHNGVSFIGTVVHWSDTGPKEHCILEHDPTIYLPNGETIAFWHGAVYQFGDKWLTESLQSFYRHYQLDADRAFPLRYTVPSTLIAGGLQGSIPGFGYYSSAGVISFTS